MRVRHSALAIVLVTLVLVAACGREAPAPGDLTVTSDPSGAAIRLDGAVTAYVTPHTFTDVEGGTYNIAVELADHTPIPAQRTVTVPYGGTAGADFTLAAHVGGLTVTSTPAGAAIMLDGTDSGFLTPHTFTDLLPGDHMVSVVLDGFDVDPESREVSVVAEETATADFALTSLAIARIVLFEGFSNVHCTGCPAFNANVEYLQSQPGYGADQVIYVKWVGDVPTPADPFYWTSQQVMDARMAYYNPAGSFNHPSLFIDGALAGAYGTPPGVTAMQSSIVAESGDADFAIIIPTPDFSDLNVDATVTLDLPADVDLTGYSLSVVLTYEEVETAAVYQGVSTFHNVVRDHVVASMNLGALAAGLHDYSVTLVEPDPTTNPVSILTPHGKALVAFVQRTSDKVVVQAGSTLTNTARAATSPPPPLHSGR